MITPFFVMCAFLLGASGYCDQSNIDSTAAQSESHASPLLKGIVLVHRAHVLCPEEFSLSEGVEVHGIEVPGGVECLRKILLPFFNEEISQEHIMVIKRQILHYYREKGKTFIAVQIPEQEITKGVLIYRITEAKINDVKYTGNRWTSNEYLNRQVHLFCGEPFCEERLLNDLSWINRNPFHHTNVTLSPGAATDTTDVELITQDRFPLRLFVGGDNTGTKYTGHSRYFAGINWGNAFWCGDLFSYQFTTTERTERFISHVANYTSFLPWRHVLNVYGGAARVRPKIKDFRSTGHSSQISGRYTIPFKPYYKAVMKEWTVGFDYKHTNNNLIYLGENDIPVIDDTVNIGQFMTGLTLGGVWKRHEFSCNLELYYSPGRLFSHSKNRDFNNLRAHAKNHYVYERITLKDDFHLPYYCSLVGMLRFQGSSDTLLPSEQFGLGGFDTVRGYPERAFNADYAGCLNLELRSKTFKVPKLKSSGLTFLIFFDWGKGSNFHAPKTLDKTDWLASVGPGVRFAISPYLTCRFDYGFQLNRLDFGGRRHGKGHGSVIGSF